MDDLVTIIFNIIFILLLFNPFIIKIIKNFINKNSRNNYYKNILVTPYKKIIKDNSNLDISIGLKELSDFLNIKMKLKNYNYCMFYQYNKEIHSLNNKMDAKEIKLRNLYFSDNSYFKFNNEEKIVSKLSSNIIDIIKKYKKYDLCIDNDSINILIDINKHIPIDAINELISLSNALTEKKSTEELLIKNIKNEKNYIIRRKNLEMLLQYDNLFIYRDIYKDLLKDNDPVIRIMVFSTLKENDLSIIYEIFKGEDEKAIELALNYLVQIKDKKSIIKVFNFFKQENNLIESNINIKISLINYFAEFKVNDVENWIIKQLISKNNTEELVSACINALKKLGSIRAVESILPYTTGIYPAEIKKQAHNAIQLIQQETKGNLSFTSINNIGELSIPEDTNKAAGNLSLDIEK